MPIRSWSTIWGLPCQQKNQREGENRTDAMRSGARLPPIERIDGKPIGVSELDPSR